MMNPSQIAEAGEGALALVKLAADPKAFDKKLQELKAAAEAARKVISDAGISGDVVSALNAARAQMRDLDAERAAFETTKNNLLREARTEADMILGNARTEAGALVEHARAEAAEAEKLMKEAKAMMATAERIQADAKELAARANSVKSEYESRIARMKAAIDA